MTSNPKKLAKQEAREQIDRIFASNPPPKEIKKAKRKENSKLLNKRVISITKPIAAIPYPEILKVTVVKRGIRIAIVPKIERSRYEGILSNLLTNLA